MKYTSTRDGSVSHTFQEALCNGYAPGGGLYVPEKLPSLLPLLSIQTLRRWSDLQDYSSLCYHVLRDFISVDEIPNEDLLRICRTSFAGFSSSCDIVVPVVKMNASSTNASNNSSSNNNNLYVAELYHGPTFCFKDLGMRVVVNMLEYFCSRSSKPTTVIVSTTGDTGPAAVQAVADANNSATSSSGSSSTSTVPPLLSILVHYPQGQISDFQRKQLTSVKSNSVRVVAFEGGGDDMDAPIKRILSSSSKSKNTKNNKDDSDENERMLTGINSYNIGRPLVQMVHFIWTYLRVMEADSSSLSELPTLDIVIPTGAMGNIVGAYMAKQMGLPIRKLIAGVNVNDITDRAISTGRFHKNPVMHQTLSEAINIQVPYNFERLLYYLTDQNHGLVKEWMVEMDETEKLDIEGEWLNKLQRDFASSSVTDDEVCEMIRHFSNDNDDDNNCHWIDPHTAVAWCAAEKLGYYNVRRANGESTCKTPPPTTATAIMSTASPCKFQEALVAAVGQERWDEYQQSEKYPKAARSVMEREETPPTLYKFNKNLSLQENQKEWEQLSRGILYELGGGLKKS